MNPIRLQLDISPLALAKWLAAALLSAVTIFPFAWVLAAIARWVCAQLRFSDGTTAEFRGDGGDIAVWTVLGLGLPAAFVALLGGGGVVAAATLVMWLGVSFMIVKWLVYNTHLSTGPQLTFVGGFASLVAYSALAKAGFLSAHRWLWAQVKGEAVEFTFEAPAGEVFWRSYAALAGVVTVIGAPWALASHLRWWFAHVTFTRGVDTSTWQLRDDSPQRLSLPGGLGRS